ncbi:MAG: hypothetical protein HFE68_02945 [Erysipelotrichaceae bacterium]|nr:hypothetical protein [Erysipelotrichaceae bacterium]MCI9312302.1 hypothetical protein [Erysipelotrichaceae bacterium]
MEKQRNLWLLVGLLLYRERLHKWLAQGNGRLMLKGEGAYELVALLGSGIYRDELLEEVCGLPLSLCEELRAHFRN